MIVSSFIIPQNLTGIFFLGKIPEEIKSLASEIGIGKAKYGDRLSSLFEQKRDLFQLFNTALNDFMRSISMPGKAGEVTFTAFSINKPNLVTTAFDHATPKFLGLHLDDYNIPFASSEPMPNRICLNFGNEKRAFLFINIDIEGFLDELRSSDLLQGETIEKKHFGLVLSKYRPSTKVLMLEQGPGEYYIAPTSNIIHDGCTYYKQSDDIALFARGYFNGFVNQLNPEYA